MKARIIAGVIAALTYECLGLDAVAVVRQDAGSDCTSVGLYALQFDLQPVLLQHLIVSKQRRRLIHVDNQQVHVAIVVEVAEGTSPAAMSR